ncbi:MAG: GNAT family N-acetyltransferase [Chloroflexota bacterium]
MDTLKVQRDGYTISTDRDRLDVPLIHEFLSQRSYWAQGRPLDVVQQSLQNSLCFGVYEGEQQVGLARVVTDYATFAWLCDVFILESHRGRSLGRWLIETVAGHPALAGRKLVLLATRNAHGLYQRYGGFEQLQDLGRWMVRSHNAQNRTGSLQANHLEETGGAITR